MAHERTETVEFDGRYHVRPTVGKKKGKTLKVFDTEEEANKWASKRSREYKPKMAKRDASEMYGFQSIDLRSC